MPFQAPLLNIHKKYDSAIKYNKTLRNNLIDDWQLTTVSHIIL